MGILGSNFVVASPWRWDLPRTRFHAISCLRQSHLTTTGRASESHGGIGSTADSDRVDGLIFHPHWRRGRV